MDLKDVKSVIESLDLKSVEKVVFMNAAQRAKGLKSLNQDQQLLLYGLYKQGTIGTVNTPQPSVFSITDNLKWKGWKKYEGLPIESAMTVYVYAVDQLLAGKPLLPPAGSPRVISNSDKTTNSAVSSPSQSFKTAVTPISVKDEPCPFDGSIHLKTSDPTSEQKELVRQLRLLLDAFPLARKHSVWADDTQLLRFLIARNFNIKDSFDLIKTALKWREFRQPSEIESGPGWPANMSLESETGKIYCPGNDKWGRSVLILDNTVQNTNSIDDQMTFLAWNLEYAIRQMPEKKVDKYLVFMHLNNFSFFNTPPMASTKETIHMLCNCYPERLGHCIAYQPPSVFRMFFNTVKGFLDAKTASKMVFIIGDVSDGSDNDKKMRELIGDNWKVLTGAEQPVLGKNCSPGYSHQRYWPTVMSNIDKLNRDKQQQQQQQEEEEEKEKAATAVSESNRGGASSDKNINNNKRDALEEEQREDRRKSAKETYSKMKSFSEAVFLKKQILRGANSEAAAGVEKEMESDKGGALGIQAIAGVDDINYLLSDMLYFLTIIGLAVLLFEWSKQHSAAGGGAV